MIRAAHAHFTLIRATHPAGRMRQEPRQGTFTQVVSLALRAGERI